LEGRYNNGQSSSKGGGDGMGLRIFEALKKI
jgi:hypothetical protein